VTNQRTFTKKRVTNAENDWRRANMAKPVNNDSNI
jgi:hypothetical protein